MDGDHASCPLCNPPAAAPAAPAATAEDRIEYAPIPLRELTAAQHTELVSWAASEEINPRTGRRIVLGGSTHAALKREYDALRTESDPEALAELNASRRLAGVEAFEARAAERAELAARATERAKAACENVSRCARKAALWRARVAADATCRECGGALAISSTHYDALGARDRSEYTAACGPCGWAMTKEFADFRMTGAEFLAAVTD